MSARATALTVSAGAFAYIMYKLYRSTRTPTREAALRDDLAAAHVLSHHFGFDECALRCFPLACTTSPLGARARCLWPQCRLCRWTLAVRLQLLAIRYSSLQHRRLVWNHISARVHDDTFLVTNGTDHFDEVTAESLVISSQANTNVTSDVIHSAIYKARPDAGAIVHHHATATVAVACAEGGLQFLTQDSAAFYGKVAYYDWEGVSDDTDECARIAAAFGDTAHTLIMRNHGVLTIGKTVCEAWVRHYYLDRVCRVQVALGGLPTVQPATDVLEHAASQYVDNSDFEHGAVHQWVALKRLSDRIMAERRLRRALSFIF